ncbi:MAG: hypothetical protein QM736_04965 [Vicinamibacterales bacterium]
MATLSSAAIGTEAINHQTHRTALVLPKMVVAASGENSITPTISTTQAQASRSADVRTTSVAARQSRFPSASDRWRVVPAPVPTVAIHVIASCACDSWPAMATPTGPSTTATTFVRTTEATPVRPVEIDDTLSARKSDLESM